MSSTETPFHEYFRLRSAIYAGDKQRQIYWLKQMGLRLGIIDGYKD